MNLTAARSRGIKKPSPLIPASPARLASPLEGGKAGVERVSESLSRTHPFHAASGGEFNVKGEKS